MRLTRARSAFVVLLAVLHLGGGVLAAFAPCCDEMSQGGVMECCLNGGPDHVCPHMLRREGESSPSSEHMAASCAGGHDDGVPVMGFAGLLPDAAIAPAPDPGHAPLDTFRGSPIVRILHPPSPPPKFSLPDA